MKTTELRRGTKIWCGWKHTHMTYAGIRSTDRIQGTSIWVFYDKTGRQRWLTAEEIERCSIEEEA